MTDNSPDAHPSNLPVEELESQCEFRRTRGSGPGGQHRNRVATAIVVKHLPSGITAQASERRSQHENRQVAIDRLRVKLAIELRRPIAEDQTPSDLWQSRISNPNPNHHSRSRIRENQTRPGRTSVSRDHFDFAAVLAEAFDFLDAADFKMAVAAKRLGISSSQLIKLIKKEPLAWQAMQQERDRRGMSRLR